MHNLGGGMVNAKIVLCERGGVTAIPNWNKYLGTWKINFFHSWGRAIRENIELILIFELQVSVSQHLDLSVIFSEFVAEISVTLE